MRFTSTLAATFLATSILFGASAAPRQSKAPLSDLQRLLDTMERRIAELEKMVSVSQAHSRATNGRCCVDGCKLESDGIDRGRPLCEHHWEEQTAKSDRIVMKHYVPPPIDLESKSVYGMLFD